MKTLLALALLAGLAHASTYTVGFEDWGGLQSDRDFNDTVFNISGVAFHTTGTWTRPSPAQFPLETPFPYSSAFYFNFVTATGPVVDVFDFSQTNATEQAFLEVGSGPWVLVGSSATLNAVAGDAVHMKLVVQGGGTFYPGADFNDDGLPHAIEATDSPEPSGLQLTVGGLILLAIAALIRFVNREPSR